MEDYKKIAEKLRYTKSESKRKLLDEAADTIERLEAERNELAIAALREREELAVLPCKPGDMVYRIVWWGKRNVDIRVRRVSSVEYNAAGEWVIHSTGSDVLGKTVFLTREEAEKALKEDA